MRKCFASVVFVALATVVSTSPAMGKDDDEAEVSKIKLAGAGKPLTKGGKLLPAKDFQQEVKVQIGRDVVTLSLEDKTETQYFALEKGKLVVRQKGKAAVPTSFTIKTSLPVRVIYPGERRIGKFFDNVPTSGEILITR